MEIAVFGGSTAWVGKRITLEASQFVLQDYGPISARSVMDYDAQGHLLWASESVRAWVAAQAGPALPAQGRGTTSAAPVDAPPDPAVATWSPAVLSDGVQRDERRSRRRTYVAVAVVAALLVVAGGIVYAVIATDRGSALHGAGPVAPVVPTPKPSAVQPSQLVWAPQESGTFDGLRGVSFVDPLHGWTVGFGNETDEPIIMATQDGGLTWERQTPPRTLPPKTVLLAVTFIDGQHGWVAGSRATILATSDGGATWIKQSAGSSSVAFQDVAFVDDAHGWAVGGDYWTGEGVILSTVDGGVTWKRQDAEGFGIFSSVIFLDDMRGWVVGEHNAILSTIDGGRIWRPQGHRSDDRQLLAVDFVDLAHGWTVGRGGVILATKNGGKTWSRRDSSGHWDLASVDFLDERRGFAAGEGGIILATSDGGRNWTLPQWTGQAFHGGLWDLAYLEDTRAWVVGFDGTILAATLPAAVPAPSGSPGAGQETAAMTIQEAVTHLQGVTADGDGVWGKAPGASREMLAVKQGDFYLVRSRSGANATWADGAVFGTAQEAVGALVSIGGIIQFEAWSAAQYQ